MHLPYLHALDGIPFDSYVTMLEYAGIGVAMGNACDAAKAAADYVTDDITADGLAKALAHFGLIRINCLPPEGDAPQGPHICGPQLYGR